jgi:Flp pilus assembly protein TadG
MRQIDTQRRCCSLLASEQKPAFRSRLAWRRGGAVLEAALILPILLSLAFGTVEYGHFFYCKHTLQGAAREGARAAIVDQGSNAEVTTAVSSSMLAAGIGSAKYTIKIRNVSDTADLDIATAPAGTGVLVKVQSTWGSLGLRPLRLISGTKQVTGQAVMRKEG